MEIQNLKLAVLGRADHRIEAVAAELGAGNGFVLEFKLGKDAMAVLIGRLIAFPLLVGNTLLSLLIAAIPRVAGSDVAGISGGIGRWFASSASSGQDGWRS